MADSAKIVVLEPDLKKQAKSRMQRLPALARMLHESGKTHLLELLSDCLDQADDAIFNLADKAGSNVDQSAFFDSMRELRVQRRALETRFESDLDTALLALVDPGFESADEHLGAELSADALSLVQNDDLEQVVALESAIRRCSRDNEGLIKRLAGGLTAIVPIQVDCNNLPFGPEVVCSSFMTQIKRLDVDIRAKLTLFKLFDRSVVAQLAELYRRQLEQLAEHGIQPPTTAAADRRRAAAGAREADSKSGVRGSAGQAPQRGMGGASAAAGDHGYSGERRELLELLSFIQQLPIGPDLDQGVDVRRMLESVQRHKGESMRLGGIEQETMQLVQTIFEFILRERSLAQPMKEQLSRLQVPILKLALMDESFLTDKRHSARRLLNEMSTLAMGWQPGADGRDDGLLGYIENTVEKIVAQFADNTGIFQDVLSEFSSFAEKQKRRAAVLEKRTIDTEDGKARTEQARLTVAREIEVRIADRTLPEVVRAMIDGPWRNVLFVTGLRDGYSSVEWAGHLQTLTELVWSVQPRTSPEERQKLIRLIPDLVQKLRAGLDTVSYNPFEVTELFAGLEEIHLARIRGEELQPAVTAAAGAGATASEASAQAGAATSASQAAAPTAANVGEPARESESPAVLPASDPHMLAAANFSQGSWFDLTEEDGSVLRCRLAAMIRATGKYIFVNRSGIKVAEKSQQELARALKLGRLQVMDNSMLFDRALENIVSSMRQRKPAAPEGQQG